MFFQTIQINNLSGNLFIPLGDSNIVDVDNRLTLENQFYVAFDYLKKSNPKENIKGVCCFRKVSDIKTAFSVEVTQAGALSFSSLGYYSSITSEDL